MITENFEQRTLNQAIKTAHDIMVAAKYQIDEVFNEEGYYKKHPELVAAFMISASLDNHAMLLRDGLLNQNDHD